MRVAILLAVLGGLLGLAGVELVARITARGHCREAPLSMWSRNAFYGWGHLPGSSAWAQRCSRDKPEWRHFVRINAHGLHDREIPYERTSARRILVLGDSFAEGFHVDFEANAVKRLERALNAPDGPGTRVEVVNAGVAGWSTDNELLYFVTEGWRYHPDIVVLMFDTGNDVFENDRQLMTGLGFYPDKPYFELVGGRLERRRYPLPPQSLVHAAAVWLFHALEPHFVFVRRLGGVSTVWRYLQSPPAAEAGLPAAHPSQVYLPHYPEAWRRAWRVTRGLVLRLRQAVEAHAARFVVVVVNGREEVSPALMRTAAVFHPELQAGVDADKPNRLITQFLARRGVASIELLDAFRDDFARDGALAFYDLDPHWTERGHALAATVIERGLVELGWLGTSREVRSSTRR